MRACDDCVSGCGFVSDIVCLGWLVVCVIMCIGVCVLTVVCGRWCVLNCMCVLL